LPGVPPAAKPPAADRRRRQCEADEGRVLRGLYDWTIGLAAHRRAPWALAAVSFAESSVFPVPPDLLLIPMVLAARGWAWTIAGLCTVASVAGGLAGYGIGYFLFDAVGRPIVEFYGYDQQFATFQGWYRDWGAWIVAGAGFRRRGRFHALPIPGHHHRQRRGRAGPGDLHGGERGVARRPVLPGGGAVVVFRTADPAVP
jgi:membrane protein YqaA with SNARE-associated domain